MARYSKICILTALAALASMWLLAACSDIDGDKVDGPSGELLAELLANPGANRWELHADSAPDDGCVRMRVAMLGPLRTVFNDSNHVHLEAARALGIKPITGDADILNLNRPLERVASCREYYLDRLTHSFPYLVPEAATLLRDIGAAFADSLSARGGGNYRIKVTSVLRTPVTVKRLRRVNSNATEESTHNYATTFDISYSKFIYDGDNGAPHRTFEDLKNLLAEVLADMRRQGCCYVKFEYKQSCFHITARPAGNSGAPEL